jgi:hypothetical protein
MFCHNCGQPVAGGSRYCSNCGAVQNTIQQIKPVITNVNQDDTLPKNSNFILTLAFILVVIFASFIFLGIYRDKYDFSQNIVYKDYKVYYPLGFKTQIGDDDEKDESKKLLYIYNDDVKYQFNYYNEDYSSYKRNDFKAIKDFLNQLGYDVQETYEKTFDDHSIIISRFKMNGDTEMYFYLYEAQKYDLVYSGYFSTSSNFDKDLNTLIKILSKVEHA